MTFTERFRRGECSFGAINDWVELWHHANLAETPLPTFLGLTDEEYALWCKDGDDALMKRLVSAAESHCTAFHLDWDELGNRLQELVSALLGSAYKISIQRHDFYYWSMKIETPAEVDEVLSAEIVEKLALQNIEPDRFTWGEDVDSSSLNGLLSKLVGREVDSNNADDYGVWIVYKTMLATPHSKAEHLIREYEKRLRTEIQSRHYPLTNPETARHQLLGFMKALEALGFIDDSECIVPPDHFSEYSNDPVPKETGETKE